LSALTALAGPADDTVIPVTAGVLAGTLALDPSGNIIAGPSGYQVDNYSYTLALSLTKYDSALNKLWTVKTPADFTLHGFAIDSQGDIVAVGTVFSTSNDVELIKYLPSGAVDWMKTTGSGHSEDGWSVGVGQGDSIVVVGTTDGQLPGQPATDSSGGGFEMTFGGDGTLATTFEYPMIDKLPMVNFQLDRAGAAYFFLATNSGKTDYRVVKLNADGTLAWINSETQQTGSIAVGTMAVPPSGPIWWLANGVNPVGNYALMRVDPATGFANAYCGHGTRTVLLDPVEGSMWQGSFSNLNVVTATPGALYVAGRYLNHYANDSAAKPDVTSVFVTKLDLTCGQVWFRQFSLQNNAVVPTGLVLGAQGQIVVSASSYVFTINESDGSLM
jgi:hypothetical protein